jgi:opacity protein-like surface antigen
MKLFVLGVAVVVGTGSAHAADFDGYVLRGTAAALPYDAPVHPRFLPGKEVTYRWDGVYIGAQVGRATSGIDYGAGVSSLLEHMLRETVILNHVREWTTLPSDQTSANSYGGFIGYNTSFEDAVLGLELNYNRTAINSAVSDSLARRFTDSSAAPPNVTHTFGVEVISSASVHITDLLTLRARAAWAYHNFLPYMFLGAAAGRADVTRSVAVSGTLTAVETITTTLPDGTVIQTPLAPVTSTLLLPPPQTVSQPGVFAFGYTAGLGIDVGLLPNVFLRGEWEWIQFPSVKDINIQINSLRAAIGFKF